MASKNFSFEPKKALEWVVRRSGIQTNGTILNTTIQLLAYADDVDLIGRSRGAVENAFIDLERATTNIGLEVNQAKTKYMHTSGAEQKQDTVQFGTYTFEWVVDFVYLGTQIVISEYKVIEKERKRRYFVNTLRQTGRQ
uniref:Reverse transcriptase domain-containing protein n=1 Tax=Rhodnius prolixus TaxID=13249 RepID=T1HD01_RHOPR